MWVSLSWARDVVKEPGFIWVSGLGCEWLLHSSPHLSTQHSPPLPARHSLGELVPCMWAGAYKSAPSKTQLTPCHSSSSPLTSLPTDSGGPVPTQCPPREGW